MVLDSRNDRICFAEIWRGPDSKACGNGTFDTVTDGDAVVELEAVDRGES